MCAACFDVWSDLLPLCKNHRDVFGSRDKSPKNNSHLIMDDLSRTQANYKNILRDINKRKKVLRQREVRNTKSQLTLPLQVLLCNLIFLHVPWTAIAVILWCATQKREKHKHGNLKPDDLQKLAEETIQKNPDLAVQANNMNNPLSVRAKAWKHEFDLAVWLLTQNKKGIAVPPRLAVHQYLSYWGMGPQPEALTEHLNTFETHKIWKHWMARFRKRWGFDYACCPKGPALKADDIGEKAIWK